MVRISVASNCPPPTDGEIADDWDIDRWENDGGKGLDTKHDNDRD